MSGAIVLPESLVRAFGLERAALIAIALPWQREADAAKANAHAERHWFERSEEDWSTKAFFIPRRTLYRHLRSLRDVGVLLGRRDAAFGNRSFQALDLATLPGDVRDVCANPIPAILAPPSLPEWHVCSSVGHVGCEPERNLRQLHHCQIGTGGEERNVLQVERSAPAVPEAPSSAEPPRRRSKAKPAEPSKGTAVWLSYAAAFRGRYGREPVRNAMVNALCSQLATRLGDDAPAVAAFFVGHNARRYVEGAHSLRMCVFDAEALHVQWSTGRQITSGTAQQVERRQTATNTLGALEALYAAKERNP